MIKKFQPIDETSLRHLLGLTTIAGEIFQDSRIGKNTQNKLNQ